MMRSLVITFAFAMVFIVTVLGGAKLDLYVMPSYTVMTTVYMTFMTSAVLWIVQKQNDRVLFSQTYLASIVFKILTGLGVIFVIIQMDPKNAPGNAALFIISYIAFTAVEVGCLLHRIRGEKK